MSFTVEIDTSEVEAEYAGAVRELLIASRFATREAAEDGAREALVTKKYRERSGDLTKSIRGTVLSEQAAPGGSTEAEIVAGTDYASYVDSGTQPHHIPGPVTFLSEKTGQWVTLPNGVDHPGAAADGFMGRAEAKARTTLDVGHERAVFVFAARMSR